MDNEYYIVNKKILPDYLEKVLKAREMLERHEVSTITEAVALAGISRNTYYKYKDYVYNANLSSTRRNAVLSVILKDEAGALSALINLLTGRNTNILTISQAIPVAGKANVLISLDISQMSCTMDELIQSLKALSCTRNVHLDAIE